MKSKNNKGFTLIEVLVAMCILSVALIAMAQLQVMAIQSNGFADRTTTASTLAQDKMEELKVLSTADAQLNNGLHPNDLAGTRWDYYSRTWGVQTDIATGLRTVTIDVMWQDNIHHKVTLTGIR